MILNNGFNIMKLTNCWVNILFIIKKSLDVESTNEKKETAVNYKEENIDFTTHHNEDNINGKLSKTNLFY